MPQFLATAMTCGFRNRRLVQSFRVGVLRATPLPAFFFTLDLRPVLAASAFRTKSAQMSALLRPAVLTFRCFAIFTTAGFFSFRVHLVLFKRNGFFFPFELIVVLYIQGKENKKINLALFSCPHLFVIYSEMQPELYDGGSDVEESKIEDMSKSGEEEEEDQQHPQVTVLVDAKEEEKKEEDKKTSQEERRIWCGVAGLVLFCMSLVIGVPSMVEFLMGGGVEIEVFLMVAAALFAVSVPMIVMAYFPRSCFGLLLCFVALTFLILSFCLFPSISTLTFVYIILASAVLFALALGLILAGSCFHQQTKIQPMYMVSEALRR